MFVQVSRLHMHMTNVPHHGIIPSGSSIYDVHKKIWFCYPSVSLSTCIHMSLLDVHMPSTWKYTLLS